MVGPYRDYVVVVPRDQLFYSLSAVNHLSLATNTLIKQAKYIKHDSQTVFS